MKRILKYSWLTVICGLLGLGCSQPGPEKTIPIVLISIDTLRADHLGCYGYSRGTSPCLDRLEREAVVFREAFSGAPTTAPAHMSIFTSLSPVVHGVRNFGEGGRPLPPSLLTLPAFLQRQGYLTVGLHGGGNIGEELGFDRGFDHYAPEFFRWPEGQGVLAAGLEELDLIEDRIRDWIRRSRREDKPLFLFLHHYLCHDPYLSGPAEYRLRFLTQPVEGLPVLPSDIDPGGGFTGMRARFFGPGDPGNPDHIQHYLDLYDGGVFYSDYIFGRLRQVLEQEGIFNNALVIVLADHGEEFADHGGLLHWKLFRETIQVPLLIRFPQGKWAGVQVTTPVSTLDIFPTVADLLGLAGKMPPHQGASLLPLVRGEALDRREPVSFSGKGDSLRLSRLDATYINQDIDGVNERVFLQGDREEKNNLAGERGGTSKLRELAGKIMAENQALELELVGAYSGSEPRPGEEKLRQLRALGYIN